jgi:hypothetical protein
MGMHPAGLSIPFVDSFDLTGVLENAARELIVRALSSISRNATVLSRSQGLPAQLFKIRIARLFPDCLFTCQ